MLDVALPASDGLGAVKSAMHIACPSLTTIYLSGASFACDVLVIVQSPQRALSPSISRESNELMRMKICPKLWVVASIILLLACCLLMSTAPAQASPAAAALKTFKIGDVDAVSLEDGRFQEPNDGKSFVLGQPTTEVASLLERAGLPGDHMDFEVHPLLVHGHGRVLLFDTGAGRSRGRGFSWCTFHSRELVELSGEWRATHGLRSHFRSGAKPCHPSHNTSPSRL